MRQKRTNRRDQYAALAGAALLAWGTLASWGPALNHALAVDGSQTSPDGQEAKQEGPQPPPQTTGRLESAEELKSLQTAIRNAMEAVADVHYVPFDSPEAQARVAEREKAWRQDMVGNNPCITGYSRARPLVVALVKKLDKEPLILLLERSLAIAESEELHAAIMGEGEYKRVRGSNYNTLLIREAVYNLSPDPELKQKALDSWLAAEMKRVEETMLGRQLEMERISALPTDERTVEESLRLDLLQNQPEEAIRSIPVWE